tara:strand:- start:384 stop:1190 length:807 start_codon:yes stop_codon:yes gene_type:complete
MKIAYTINGLVGGLTGKNSTESLRDEQIAILKYVSNLLQKHITTHNDVDFFIFSWHTDFENEFETFIKPKKMKLIPQVDFEIPEHLQGANINRVIAHYSRWYGFKEVMKLMSEYESQNDFEYDLVVSARFDICWNKPYYFKNLNNNQFHIPIHPDASSYGWPDQGPEILDHIFASNTVWMKQYSNMFDHLDEYTSPGQCPQWKTISNHFLMVWHLQKLNLLSDDIVKKSFTNWSDNNPKIIGGSKDDDIDYDIFRYRKLNMEDLLNHE